jgi:hypothetical protein
MVAKVICGKNIKGAVAYNEHKVAQGVAECLLASKFGLSTEQLSLHQKIVRFEKLLQLNTRVKTNAVHISLNFHESENLTKDDLVKIASAYIDKIGFGSQPYLVYEHRDAAHPHVHIVTTNITNEGKRIDLHNIGKERSEEARKAIEKDFGLIRAEGRRTCENLAVPKPANPITYGRTQTKKAISDVVRFATSQYKYSSLPDLNAILSHYNVTAFRGYEGSKMYRNQGLVYSIIDCAGNRVGVPIKASSINGKSTIKALEGQFKLGSFLKKPLAAETRTTIESVLALRRCESLDTFQKQLGKKNIDLLIRKSDNGQIYGLTYVDHARRVVFKGSDLGKHLGANGIRERFSSMPLKAQKEISYGAAISNTHKSEPAPNSRLDRHLELIEKIVSPEQANDGAPVTNQDRKRRKRKRKSI